MWEIDHWIINVRQYLNLKVMRKVDWWLRCENWEKLRKNKLRGFILNLNNGILHEIQMTNDMLYDWLMQLRVFLFGY
jgi:hypothetical protein